MRTELVLYFDINGTIYLPDGSKKATGEEMLIAALAETTLGNWGESPFPLSFKEHVYKILPGDKSDGALKAQRREKIQGFLTFLKEENHPQFQEVSQKYDEILSKFKDPVTAETKFTVFLSFYVMLEKLRELNLPFTVIFRTFGEDLPVVVEEIKKDPHGLKEVGSGFFKQHTFTLKTAEGDKTLQAVSDIFEAFRTSSHLAVQDDWGFWNRAGEVSEAGKLFPVDAIGESQEKVVSIFFDDNAEEEEEDLNFEPTKSPKKGIICVKDVSGIDIGCIKNSRIVKVDTLVAVLNENYFIDKVMSVLRDNRIFA